MTDVETDQTAPDDAPAAEASPGQGPESADAYRVLARKYRPQTFSELIGQEALVRTLTNAIAQDRIAHAFMLTGVRGIGKTTTARIIARALNCVGPDGAGGITAEPCGRCEPCLAIAEDRHLDVIEMDAASRTGVDDVRDLIESVRYRPTSARYKVYIIDEVHMLSKNAFNALLKTLEEPPEHVKFVFATTEIRKVPITVLSRCQRFDLKRLDRETMSAHLSTVAAEEGAKLSEEALAMIARAADGSVRDGLSLLDQAIALSPDALKGGEITGEAVRDMLGLADQARVLDLYELLMKGEIGAALELGRELYRAGADPVMLVQDLLDLTHWLTRLKIVSDAAEGLAVSEAERARAAEMAGGLAMATLSRAWQMLLKGLSEVQSSHAPMTALEMALVRLAYAAELPAPGDIVRSLQDGDAPGPSAAPSTPPAKKPAPDASAAAPAPPAPSAPSGPAPSGPAAPAPASSGDGGGAQPALAIEDHPDPAPEPAPETMQDAPDGPPADPKSFDEVVALFQARREGMLYAQLKSNVHLVSFAPGRIEFRAANGAPETLATRVGRLLTEWTGSKWVLHASTEPGEPTLAEQEAADLAARREKAAGHPLVKAVLDSFPGAEIEAVRDLAASAAPEDAGTDDDLPPQPEDPDSEDPETQA